MLLCLSAVVGVQNKAANMSYQANGPKVGKEMYFWNSGARADSFKSVLARARTRAYCELWLSTGLRLIRFVEHIKSRALAGHYCENLVQSGYIEDATYSIISAADDESMTATDD